MNSVRTATALLLLGVLIGGCGNETAQDQKIDPPAPIVSVRLVTVQQRTMPVTVTANGLTDVLGREWVVAPIDGTIVSIDGEVGTEVSVGDTVAVLRTRDSEAAIAGAQRLIDDAKSSQQRDQAQRAMTVAREAERLVAVVAGRHGVVVSRSASSGQAVTADTELLELVDLATLDFVASLPLADLAWVKPMQAARISFPSLQGHDFVARVVTVSAQSDPQSQAVPVLLEFAEQPITLRSLRVGMMGSASITVGEHPDVLVVPSTALLRNDLADTYTIYTVGPDSLAHQLPVAVGVVTDSVAEVSSPSLKPGDQVIVEGNYEVSDSTRITVRSGGPR